MTEADSAAAKPAQGASQRRSTSRYNSPRIGRPASAIDQMGDQKILPLSGSRCCWKTSARSMAGVLYKQVGWPDCKAGQIGSKWHLRGSREREGNGADKMGL